MGKQRGRKAGAGTVEAREYVESGALEQLLTVQKELSYDCLIRLVKAVRFGLGIKKEEVK